MKKKINYEELTEITVKSQKELDDIPETFKGRIYVEFGTVFNKAVINKKYYYKVVARGNSSVVAFGNSSVEALGNSSVVAFGNSSVEALGNSSVVARENSSVVARENSSVVARGNSSVVAFGNSSVEALGNSSVVALGNSSVEALGNSSVVARENSSVVARGNSSVEALGNSSVVARENSSVVARGNSSVVAFGNSSVVARGNSSVVAFGNSSVEALGNSSVEAFGNSQIVDRLSGGKIKISGNSRIVYMPKNIQEFMEFYKIKHTKTKATFYKAVQKINGKYLSNWNNEFEYEVGKFKSEECNEDVNEECSYGIHISHLNWALDFGESFENLAILEVETQIKNIVMPVNSDGKIRTSKIKVIREVPLEECGTYGKILARRRKND